MNPERARAYELGRSRREVDNYRYEYTPPVLSKVRIAGQDLLRSTRRGDIGIPVSALDKRIKIVLNQCAECGLSRAGSPRSQEAALWSRS